MKIQEISTMPANEAVDLQAVADAVASGMPIDPELKQRVLERSRVAREALLLHYGVREIAVDLIRQGRDE